MENTNRTHTKCGKELSAMFIGDDGILSVFINDEECEVIGSKSTVFFDAFNCKTK